MTDHDLAGTIEDLLRDIRLSPNESRLSRTDQQLSEATGESLADVADALADLATRGKVHRTAGGDWMSNTRNR
jgi:hypothetical protein